MTILVLEQKVLGDKVLLIKYIKKIKRLTDVIFPLTFCQVSIIKSTFSSSTFIGFKYEQLGVSNDLKDWFIAQE